MHHYFFIVVSRGGLVFLGAESGHDFISKEDGVGVEVGDEEVEPEIEFESVD